MTVPVFAATPGVSYDAAGDQVHLNWRGANGEVEATFIRLKVNGSGKLVFDRPTVNHPAVQSDSNGFISEE